VDVEPEGPFALEAADVFALAKEVGHGGWLVGGGRIGRIGRRGSEGGEGRRESEGVD
jgi:hypothetical protein